MKCKVDVLVARLSFFTSLASASSRLLKFQFKSVLNFPFVITKSTFFKFQFTSFPLTVPSIEKFPSFVTIRQRTRPLACKLKRS